MERYRRLVESAPDGILVVEDERIAFVNAAAVDLFGANGPEHLLGRSLFDLLDADSHGASANTSRSWRAGRRRCRSTRRSSGRMAASATSA